MMRRRQFITLVTGAVVVRPLGAQAQQAEQMRRIGVLMTGPADDTEQQELVAIFGKALSALGWNEGRNLKTYLRWGAASAKDIVALEPEVILAFPTIVLLPLRKETKSIPIVFVGVSDPLAQGIVTSLARPTGNITGFANPQFSLVGKSLQLLKDAAPDVSRVALMISTRNGSAAGYFRAFRTLAASFALMPITVAKLSVLRHTRQSACREMPRRHRFRQAIDAVDRRADRRTVAPYLYFVDKGQADRQIFVDDRLYRARTTSRAWCLARRRIQSLRASCG